MLTELAAPVRAVVFNTGPPPRLFVAIPHLAHVAHLLRADAELMVMGQYGNERWDSRSRAFTSPEPPAGLSAFRDELPGLLAAADAGDAHVEEKGLAVAVHTRRLTDPRAAFDRLQERLADSADRHGLLLEPGRLVLEVRAPGMHKGKAVRAAFEEHDGEGVLFIGDDLGDLEAFEAARALSDEGVPTLLVCSGSEEQEALVEISDIVVPGPDGVMALLASYARDARG